MMYNNNVYLNIGFNNYHLGGRLRALESVKNSTDKVLCECICGNEKRIIAIEFKLGRIRSCGCLKKEGLVRRNTKHGLNHHILYSTWIGMKYRCFNINSKCYDCYGGRGIKVCKKWINSFESFYKWAMENGWAEGLTLERLGNNKDYSPKNCVWADRKTQSRNTRRNHIIEAFGEAKCLAEWVEDERCVVNYSILVARINRYKWKIEDAITKPTIKLYQAFGEEKTLNEWVEDERCKVKYDTLRTRINVYNWDIEKSILTPSRKKEE